MTIHLGGFYISINKWAIALPMLVQVTFLNLKAFEVWNVSWWIILLPTIIWWSLFILISVIAYIIIRIDIK